MTAAIPRFALGLDLGGTKILAALVDAEGHAVRTWRVATPAAAGGAAVLAALGAAAEAALESLEPAQRAGLQGVGVSAAGQIDPTTGTVLYASPNLPGWTGTAVAAALSARLGLPVRCDNDGNAAAFGEWWAGAGRGCRSLVAITLGTGVGGGLILDGQVWRGGRFRGGELGHMIVQAEGAPCNCGQAGCLEVYASGTAIARLAREARPGWEPDGRAVFAAADQGDEVALAVLRRSARFLAAGIVSLTSLLDPDRFVLGGGVAGQPRYLALVREALADPALAGQRPFDQARLDLAWLGEAAGAVGAAGLFLVL